MEKAEPPYARECMGGLVAYKSRYRKLLSQCKP